MSTTNNKPDRADYASDAEYEAAMMKYLQATNQVSRPRLFYTEDERKRYGEDFFRLRDEPTLPLPQQEVPQEQQQQPQAQSIKPDRANYPDDRSFEDAMMKYLHDTQQVSRPGLEPQTEEERQKNIREAREYYEARWRQRRVVMPRGYEEEYQQQQQQQSQNEQVIWRRDLTEGFWKKKVTEVQMITTRGIRHNGQLVLDFATILHLLFEK
jgi:hypothetical protein